MGRLLLLFVALLSAAAAAQLPSADDHADHLQVHLLSEDATVARNQEFWVGLDFQLEPRWHVYWVNPGDSGQAPTVKWTLPQGVVAGDIQWPKPERIAIASLTDYGYSDHVLLMVPLHASAAVSSELPLVADVHWLVCREVCIPGKARLERKLPVGTTAVLDSKAHPFFEQTRSLIPGPAPSSVQATAQATAEDFVVHVKTGARESAAQFFPLEEMQIDNAAAQKITPERDGLDLRLKKSEGLSKTPATLQGLLVLGSGKFFLLDAPLSGAANAVASKTKASPLAGIVGLAFAGGLILNLMPCVFPVLSLKVLALAQLRHDEKRTARIHGLWYALGILVSFWLLVALLLGLRAAGHQVGWGFQLQSPIFVVSMAALLFLMGLNLLGVFEIGTSIMGAGSSLASKPGYTGSFFTGVLATVVATPCAAPFMGTAVGFALTQSAATALLIFSALALGLAAPYLLLSFAPGWAKLLPRPGEWMLRLKQALAFPMFAATIWLVWVFANQLGVDAAARLLAGMLLIAVAAWVYGAFTGRTVRYVVAALLLPLGLYLPMSAAEGSHTVQASSAAPAPAAGLVWEKFSSEKLSALRKEGKPVLVDFTAAWCLSCQVNERAVFHASEVQQKIQQRGVTLMKADWTSYDPVITDTLASYGRSSVPFYVMYGATPNSDPLISTELLTPQSMLDALSKVQ